MNWRVFYAVTMWTLLFWEWGADYTIVKNRHVGLDIGTGRRAVNVPAIQAGRVVAVIKTPAMGYVIVLDTGLPGEWRYHAYCHMSGDRLPRWGQWIDRNERVGRLAAGPRGLPIADLEYGGTAWTGIHLHLVMSNKMDGAYRLNTGARFGNPETFIRDALAGKPASGQSRPFDPEEDDMFSDQDRQTLDALKEKVAGLDTRRDVALIWIGGDCFVVDHGAGTKWNVARGQRSIEDALAYIRFLRNLGITEYENQAPFVLAGYRDTTGEGSIRDEVAAGIRQAVQS